MQDREPRRPNPRQLLRDDVEQYGTENGLNIRTRIRPEDLSVEVLIVKSSGESPNGNQNNDVPEAKLKQAQDRVNSIAGRKQFSGEGWHDVTVTNDGEPSVDATVNHYNRRDPIKSNRW